MSGLAGLWLFSYLWSVFAVWAVLSVVSRCRAIFDLSEQSINPDLCVCLSLSLSFTLSLDLKCSLFVSLFFCFSRCSVVRCGSALLPNGCCHVGHTNSSGPKAPKMQQNSICSIHLSLQTSSPSPNEMLHVLVLELNQSIYNILFLKPFSKDHSFMKPFTLSFVNSYSFKNYCCPTFEIHLSKMYLICI